MLKQLRKISTMLKIANPFWEYRIDKYSLPNGNPAEYHYVNSAGSTLIIPFFNDGDLLVTRQFRYLNQKESIEFPGGGLKKGMEYLDNAKQELLEETGYSAVKFVELAEFNPYNGVTNEICKVYIATELVKNAPNPEQTEEFELLKISIDKFEKLISHGLIWDGMTLATWNLYKYLKQTKR